MLNRWVFLAPALKGFLISHRSTLRSSQYFLVWRSNHVGSEPHGIAALYGRMAARSRRSLMNIKDRDIKDANAHPYDALFIRVTTVSLSFIIFLAVLSAVSWDQR